MTDDREETDPATRANQEVGRAVADDESDFESLVAHLYRAEVDREVNWRQRLDSTTNWAVTIIAAILAYAFSQSDVANSIILVAMLIGVVFLVIEARRFQRYDIWRSRVRSMQENLFAPSLDPSEGVEQADWRRQLSEDYRSPEMKLTLLNALAHRLRRIYLPLETALVLVWLLRLGGADEGLVSAAGVSGVPGWLVIGVVVLVYVGLFVVTVWPTVVVPTETGQAVDQGNLRREE